MAADLRGSWAEGWSVDASVDLSLAPNHLIAAHSRAVRPSTSDPSGGFVKKGAPDEPVMPPADAMEGLEIMDGLEELATPDVQRTSSIVEEATPGEALDAERDALASLLNWSGACNVPAISPPGHEHFPARPDSLTPPHSVACCTSFCRAPY